MFIYPPLSDPSQQIRVLELDPADSFDRPLTGHLLVLPGLSDAQYEALSYSWDGAYDDETLSSGAISLSNQEFPIMGNLSNVLRRLRYTDRPRRVWIDAVCIDQDNVPERSAQVAMMHSIYARAESVLVWLGENSDLEDGTLVFGLGRYALSHDEVHRDASDLLSARPSPVIGAICQRFLERRYFRRRWVVQEVLSSRNATFERIKVLCGSHRTSWASLVAGLRSVKHIVHLVDTKDRAHQHLLASAPAMVEASRRDSLQVLRAFNHLECRDPRDRIYALSSISQTTTVDYTLSGEEVYTNFAAAAIDNIPGSWRTILLIAACQAALGTRIDEGKLPTRVPDWRVEWPVTPTLRDAGDPEHALLKPEWRRHHSNIYWGHIPILRLPVFGVIDVVGRLNARCITLVDESSVQHQQEDAKRFVYIGDTSKLTPKLETGDVLCEPVCKHDVFLAMMATVLRPIVEHHFIPKNKRQSKVGRSGNVLPAYTVVGLCRLDSFGDQLLRPSNRRLILY